MTRKRPSRPVFPIVLIATGVFLLAGAAYWFNSGAPQSPAVPPASAPANVNTIPYPDVPRVSVEEAKAALDEGQAVLVDVRGDPWYDQGHLPGALNLSIDQLPGQLNKNDWIITYCT